MNKRNLVSTRRLFIPGNETASLLAWWILRKMKSTEEGVAELANCYMLASTVSTRLPATMAKREGFHFEETLTGFKWMGSRSAQLVELGNKVGLRCARRSSLIVMRSMSYISTNHNSSPTPTPFSVPLLRVLFRCCSRSRKRSVTWSRRRPSWRKTASRPPP